jgi:hypothetical protein
MSKHMSYISIYTYVHIYIYIYICVCVCIYILDLHGLSFRAGGGGGGGGQVAAFISGLPGGVYRVAALISLFLVKSSSRGFDDRI